MKLWKKISVISIVILAIVITICSGILLKYVKDNILQLTVDNLLVEQQNLSISFGEMVQYYIRDDVDSAAQASAAKYCFSRFASETSVLVHNEETLYSSVAIEPQTVLPLPSGYSQQVFLDVVDDWNIVMVGSRVPIFSDEYSIYVVKDVTGIYNNIVVMVWRFALICVTGIALGTLLTMLLLKGALRPLMDLKDATRNISIGEYGGRVEINSRDEVGELAMDFNVMADAVERHIEMLEDRTQRQRLFIHGLTHEFKTPMTSMLIHTDTLLNTNLDEESKEQSLLHINSQCRWLDSLTQKLLRLITLREEVDIRPRSVGDLILDVVQSTDRTIRNRGVHLKTECRIDTLYMDYDLLKSLLINLVDNASKASRAGQYIYLRAYENIIEVVDEGVGIPEDEIDRVMDIFYMVDQSRSKAEGGSGLGLALAKEIADAHNAKLSIESRVDLGTTVRILFPHNKIFTSP